ncbi:Na(+)/H(+) antiporter subunit C [Georgenia satyanarayanai]|uniref:Na(+)/H(+) antiporter subunit C n=1 Tax=Georgenia satyanarayanai TaxID=860221 RepID=UPI0012645867|nr:Na(+)/H(+) antiporter subunit C [Georgenia satyanarayanai]
MIDTSPSLALVLLVGVLVGAGVYLLLERSLTRIIIGISMISNGVNVMFLVASGRAGGPPLVGTTAPENMSDPLPQALVLTAIVITLGLTAFLLSVAYRAWQLNGHDEVQDDLEDRRIVRLAESNEVPARSTDDAGTSLAEDAALSRDETLVLPHHDGRRRRRPGIGLDDEELR